MTPELAGLIADGVLNAIQAIEGTPTKADILAVIEKAMKAASDAAMQAQFPGEAP